MIQLDALRCFCTVVDTGSFHAAARELHRTQPAISQRLRALERQCGETLLDRRTRKPTAAGRIVLERGRALLRAAEALEAEVRESIAAGGELRIGTSDTNALYFLPEHVSAFARRMPDVRVFVHCRSTDEVAESVERGGLDLGIVTLPLKRTDLNMGSLFEQRLVAIVPQKHSLAKRSRITLSDFENEPMVLIQESTRTGAQLRRFFENERFTPNVVMDSGSFEVIKQYVAENVGVSIVPELALRPDDARRLKPLDLPGLPHVAIGAVWRAHGHHTRAVKTFLDILFARQTP